MMMLGALLILTLGSIQRNSLDTGRLYLPDVCRFTYCSCSCGAKDEIILGVIITPSSVC